MSARLHLLLLASLVLLAVGACDPVRSSQIDALGGEAAGVRTGPLHRPGQPCTLCHDGALGDPPAFSVAGTIFQSESSTTPLADATISFKGADGTEYETTSNAAGNFYVTPSRYSPVFPLHVAVTSGGTTVEMQSHIGWASSCATCHADPAGPDSPGHVYFEVPDGRVP